jgi:hypothetical protein
MALITSAQSGNFNDPATWTGGVVPTVGDEARVSSGHTVTITANATCDEVSNNGGGGGMGRIVLNDGVTLTAKVTHKNTTNGNAGAFLVFSANSPATATIIGNCTYAGVTNGSIGSGSAVQNSGTGTLNIIGNCSISGANGNIISVYNTSNGTIIITGNCTGGNGFENRAVQNNSGGTIIITGNCIGSPLNAQNSVGVFNAASGSVTITGNCTGNLSVGAVNNSTGSLTIIGNCTGGTNASAGATNNSVGTMIVNGSIYASETASGVAGGSRGQVTRLTGPFYTSPTFGVNPISCVAWRWDTSLVNTTFIQVPTQNLAALRNLVTPDNATNFPSANNVRSGTTYGISNSLSGTCAVPPNTSVRAGVPVDNTTGTIALTPEDIWNVLISGINTSGSIGARLKNVATIDYIGQQLADALSP